MSPASYLTAPPRVAAVNCITADLYDPRGVLACPRLLPPRRPRIDRLRRLARMAALEDGARHVAGRLRRSRARHAVGRDGRAAGGLAHGRDRAPLRGDHAPAVVTRGARADPGGRG